MITNILVAIICMVAFFTSFWAYRRGLNDGLALKDNKPIEPIKSPVAVIQERTQVKEATEAEQIQNQFLSNLLAYDGNPKKEVD